MAEAEKSKDPETTSTHTVLIADDEPLMRRALHRLLGQDERIEVVGKAADGEAAVDAAAAAAPDVVLMDVKMPGIDGVTAARRIKENSPDTELLMLTVSDDKETLFAAVEAGARGYLLKDVPPERLPDYVLRAARGEAVFTGELADWILTAFAERPAAESRSRNVSLQRLTPRERDVLERVSRGRSNAEVAGDLNISENTVKKHLSSILNKLHLDNRVQAATAYVRGRSPGADTGA